MLINCPRCGFQQPKDTYCAQCGIDMESFKPANPPFLKRLFSSVLIQLGLIGIVAVGISITLIKPNKFENQPRFTSARSFLQISNTSTSDSSSSNNAEESPPAEDVAELAQAKSAQEGTINAYRVANPQDAESREPSEASAKVLPAAAPGSAKAAADKSASSRLLVTYAEVGRNTLNRLFDNSRNTGQFMNLAEYSAGIISAPAKFTSSPQVKVLLQVEKSIEDLRSFQWAYLIPNQKESEPDIGLMMYLDFNEVDANSLRGNVEVQWNWKDLTNHGNDPYSRKTFPAFFEISGETGFFMAGVISHQSRLENENSSSHEIFKIFKSPQFKEGESEFVIFIEYKK